MDALAAALRILDRAVAEQRTNVGRIGELEDPLDRLPDLSEAGAVAASARAQKVLDDIAALDTASLPADLALNVEVARVTLERQAKAGGWYWLVFDPLSVGFFAMFATTAYGGGYLLNQLNTLLAQRVFTQAGDLDRYLGLMEDYARVVRQLHARSVGQAERGIHLPAPQLEQARALMPRLAAAAAVVTVPSAERLAAVGGAAAAETIAARVAGTVTVAYAELVAWLDDPQRLADAPESVGLSQYPGGAEVYAELVRQHTTLDLTPAEVHERGLQRTAEIRKEMQQILDETGATHAVHEHLDHIAADEAWRARGPEELTAFFRKYHERIAPHIESAFRFLPKADADVAPLAAEMAGSMTFGYYEAPNDTEKRGIYYFNTPNLSEQPLAKVASLNYHELVPGHHFHIASQLENDGLHPVRRNSYFNAFNEGWAEYAATLAGELGMYEAPEERFGKLVMEAFLTSRLVVDTGMNALGWTLEQARDHMREHAFVSESEIRTESLRYSCDIPGQSLGYKIGDLFLQDLREEQRAALGDAFDLRDFHDAVLRPGGLPLALVAANVRAVGGHAAG